jgi:ABC-type proline/glycine betaine transport system permease subunit
MVTAAVVVFLGGLLAGPSRHLSDMFVLAAFGVLIPSVALAWLGLPIASERPSYPIAPVQEHLS